MCLLTVRSHESRQQAPDLKLTERPARTVLVQSAEVTLHAGCCLALLRGLRPLGDFNIPKQQPAFAVLREHYRDFYRSIQAWIQFIFQPTANYLAELGGKGIGTLAAPDDNLRIRLGTRISELERRLNDAHAQYQWDDVQPLDRTAMPARSPWELMIACIALENQFGSSTDRLQASITGKGDMLSHLRIFIRDTSSEWDVGDGKSPGSRAKLYGGFPRMTFCTLDTTQKQPKIVLGFTAASWSVHSTPLRKWAKECRDESLAPYREGSFLDRRERAVKALKERERADGKWNQEVMTATVECFRLKENLKPFGHGPPGFAIEFPSLDARKRCMVCLSSTEYIIAAEGAGLASTIVKSIYAKNAESCAEFEVGLLIIKHDCLCQSSRSRKLHLLGLVYSKAMKKFSR
ncbi:MAG: hypothetical protein Q9173_001293 [Seirophora scorigena]